MIPQLILVAAFLFLFLFLLEKPRFIVYHLTFSRSVLFDQSNSQNNAWLLFK